MERNIVVEEYRCHGIENQNIEIIERKGIGHPDTLADGLSEAVSRSLSKEYLDRFDNILHHNTDKVLIVGGSAKTEFGNGEIEKPIHVVLSGRGTKYAGNEEIPVDAIAKESAKKFLDDTVRFLDTDKHIELESRIGSGSIDLKNVFERKGIPSANDTSIGVGYAPLSETEKLVIETEKSLNSEKMKRNLPAIGEDIKVMAQRENNHIDLTIAMATISSLLDDLDHYISLKEKVKNHIENLATRITDKEVDVQINTADDEENGIIYYTVTGTSAEQGDDGMTGRGNRSNGLIPFGRPMSLEAAAGKNPVNHVGKLYNLLAGEIAKKISEEKEGVKEVFVKVLSQIGKPIDNPQILNIQLIPEKEEEISKLENDSKKIANEQLENIEELSERILAGELQVY